MFAETKPANPRNELRGQLSRLASLLAVTIELLQKDARSREMVKNLFRALQLFKENRLGVVLATENSLQTPALREIINEPVAHLPLSGRIKTAMRNSNVRTLREVLEIKERQLFALNNMGRGSVKQLGEYLNSLGCWIGMTEAEIKSVLLISEECMTEQLVLHDRNEDQ